MHRTVLSSADSSDSIPALDPQTPFQNGSEREASLSPPDLVDTLLAEYHHLYGSTKTHSKTIKPLQDFLNYNKKSYSEMLLERNITNLYETAKCDNVESIERVFPIAATSGSLTRKLRSGGKVSWDE